MEFQPDGFKAELKQILRWVALYSQSFLLIAEQLSPTIVSQVEGRVKQVLKSFPKM